MDRLSKSSDSVLARELVEELWYGTEDEPVKSESSVEENKSRGRITEIKKDKKKKEELPFAKMNRKDPRLNTRYSSCLPSPDLTTVQRDSHPGTDSPAYNPRPSLANINLLALGYPEGEEIDLNELEKDFATVSSTNMQLYPEYSCDHSFHFRGDHKHISRVSKECSQTELLHEAHLPEVSPGHVNFNVSAAQSSLNTLSRQEIEKLWCEELDDTEEQDEKVSLIKLEPRSLDTVSSVSSRSIGIQVFGEVKEVKSVHTDTSDLDQDTPRRGSKDSHGSIESNDTLSSSRISIIRSSEMYMKAVCLPTVVETQTPRLTYKGVSFKKDTDKDELNPSERHLAYLNVIKGENDEKVKDAKKTLPKRADKSEKRKSPPSVGDKHDEKKTPLLSEDKHEKKKTDPVTEDKHERKKKIKKEHVEEKESSESLEDEYALEEGSIISLPLKKSKLKTLVHDFLHRGDEIHELLPPRRGVREDSKLDLVKDESTELPKYSDTESEEEAPFKKPAESKIKKFLKRGSVEMLKSVKKEKRRPSRTLGKKDKMSKDSIVEQAEGDEGQEEQEMSISWDDYGKYRTSNISEQSLNFQREKLQTYDEILEFEAREIQNVIKNLDHPITKEEIQHYFKHGVHGPLVLQSEEDIPKQVEQEKPPDREETTDVKVISILGLITARDLLIAYGYNVDNSILATRDRDFKLRLQCAINEAKIWTNKLTMKQASFLIKISKYYAHIKQYFLHVVEAIVNDRITTEEKLHSFMLLLEKVVAQDYNLGAITMI